MKTSTRTRKDTTEEVRSSTYQFYINKYFNLFMNAYQIEGMDEEQSYYFLKKMWSDGKIAAFLVKNTKSELNPSGILCLTPFTPFQYNIYDFPIKVNLINARGGSFIPASPLEVNKECVLGFAQRNQKSVFSLVEFYISKIVECEMTIRTNLKAHKMPWLIAINPENESKMNELWNRIENDDPSLFISSEDASSMKALISGAQYIIDKLYQYKQALENELLTYLGIDNLGTSEKKEHLITAEVDTKQDIIAESSNCFLSCMEEFAKKVKEVLSFEISISLREPPVEFIEHKNPPMEDENNATM